MKPKRFAVYVREPCAQGWRRIGIYKMRASADKRFLAEVKRLKLPVRSSLATNAIGMFGIANRFKFFTGGGIAYGVVLDFYC